MALVERAVAARVDARFLPSCVTSGAQRKKTSSSFSRKRSGRCLQAQRLEDSSFYVNTAFNHYAKKNNKTQVIQHHTLGFLRGGLVLVAAFSVAQYMKKR